MKLKGYDAIVYAENGGDTDTVGLCSYRSPIEDPRENLTPAEARDIAGEDPSLIYCYAITNEQIEALEREAGAAGDLGQVALCWIAMDRIYVDPDDDSPMADAVQSYLEHFDAVSARAECARVITDAEAMDDGDC